MSLWVACISREGVSLATDSAQGLNFDGESRAELGQKVWPLGSGVWIAAAGAFRLWPPPASWPDPTPDGDMPPRNFDQLLRALGDQLDGDALTSSSYQVAVVSVSDGFPKLGKLTSRRIEIARPGTIFTGSYANGVRLSAPALAPTSLTKCRDLVIALASRALRTYRDAKNSEAGPSIAWPVHFYEWKWKGTTGTAYTHEVIPEAEGPGAERRHFAFTKAAETLPKLSPLIYTDILTVLESRGLLPEDITGIVAISPHLSITIRSPADAAPTTSPAGLVTETPAETPPKPTLPS